MILMESVERGLVKIIVDDICLIEKRKISCDYKTYLESLHSEVMLLIIEEWVELGCV